MTEKVKKLPVRVDPERLSKPAARALDTVKRGRLMMEFMVGEDGPSQRRFTVIPLGRTIPPEDADELLNKGLLKPLNDGLFADSSQTWVAA